MVTYETYPELQSKQDTVFFGMFSIQLFDNLYSGIKELVNNVNECKAVCLKEYC